MPDAVSIAGIGRRFDLVSTPGGAALEDASGRRLDQEEGEDRLAAAARLWRRWPPSWTAAVSACRHGLVAIGGFAFDPARDPAARGWLPGGALPRARAGRDAGQGRTYASGDLELLEQPPAWEAPGARRFAVEPVRAEADWMAAVAGAAGRLRSGEAAKVVLAAR